MKSKCYTMLQNLPLNTFLTNHLSKVAFHLYWCLITLRLWWWLKKATERRKCNNFIPGSCSLTDADGCQTIQGIFL